MSFFDNARHSKFLKTTEKLENASRFIGYYLDRLSIASEPSLAQRSISLIARSPASPMATALLEALPECQGVSAHIEILFCQTAPAEALARWLELAVQPEAGDSLPFIQLRRAVHPNLTDAHEQVVLGTAFAWQGDSMRRDPATRDAFEIFECFNAEAARRTGRAFQLMWGKGEPIAGVRSGIGRGDLPAAVLGLTPDGQAKPVPGASRH